MFLIKKQPTYQLGRVSYSPFFNFDSLFNQAFDRLEHSYESRLKLNETDSQYELSIEIPGYSQKDLEVSVSDYILTIRAKNDLRGETKREISLWEGIDFDKVTGKLENGLLTVKLPKIEKIKPVKVKIE
jgi:HSP20 family protein